MSGQWARVFYGIIFHLKDFESESDFSLLFICNSLDSSGGLECPILILHSADVPTLGSLIKLKLECLVIGNLVLIRGYIHTLTKNAKSFINFGEWSIFYEIHFEWAILYIKISYMKQFKIHN